MTEPTKKKDDPRVKREDVKVHPGVKSALRKEAARLNVFDYQITEEAIRRLLIQTKTVPDDEGCPVLSDADAALVADLLEMIHDSSYRGSVADMVYAWKKGSAKTSKLAVAQAKVSPAEKVQRG